MKKAGMPANAMTIATIPDIIDHMPKLFPIS
jgi:hypothetical protein